MERLPKQHRETLDMQVGTQDETVYLFQTSGHNLDTCIYFKQCCVCKSRFSVGLLLVKTSCKDFFCRVCGVTIMVRFVNGTERELVSCNKAFIYVFLYR